MTSLSILYIQALTMQGNNQNYFRVTNNYMLKKNLKLTNQ